MPHAGWTRSGEDLYGFAEAELTAAQRRELEQTSANVRQLLEHRDHDGRPLPVSNIRKLAPAMLGVDDAYSRLRPVLEHREDRGRPSAAKDMLEVFTTMIEHDCPLDWAFSYRFGQSG
jgi:hypothetical protein